MRSTARCQHEGAVLTIDLGAIAANYALLRERLERAELAAVVKADAYGLGMAKVAPALAAAGCRTFCVACIDEGLALRTLLPEAAIWVFNGAPRGCETEFLAAGLTPVLNSLGDIAAFAAAGRAEGVPAPAVIHLDTGMARLGLPASEATLLLAEPERLEGVAVVAVMSHLACADTPRHPLNRRQLDAFLDFRKEFPEAKGSLANSSGIFLGADYHFDIARSGAALWGLAPHPDSPNPMAQVVRLQGRILQVRDVDTPGTVGYGATHQVAGKARIATIPVGYADGLRRSLGNRGSAFLGGVRVPVVGRVSMDLVMLDVTGVPNAAAHPGALVDLIGPDNPVDDMARDAGTIGYEILTGLGRRFRRLHVDGERAP